MPKISELNSKENQLLSAWVQFLSAKSAQDLESAARAVPEIDQLVGELTKMSSNKEFINILNKNEMDKRIAQLAQAEALSDARQEGREEGRQVGREEGRQEGQTLATVTAVQKILQKKLNLSPESTTSRLSRLSAPQLEALLDAALDFQSASEFESWLEMNV